MQGAGGAVALNRDGGVTRLLTGGPCCNWPQRCWLGRPAVADWVGAVVGSRGPSGISAEAQGAFGVGIAVLTREAAIGACGAGAAKDC